MTVCKNCSLTTYDANHACLLADRVMWFTRGTPVCPPVRLSRFEMIFWLLGMLMSELIVNRRWKTKLKICFSVSVIHYRKANRVTLVKMAENLPRDCSFNDTLKVDLKQNLECPKSRNHVTCLQGWNSWQQLLGLASDYAASALIILREAW